MPGTFTNVQLKPSTDPNEGMAWHWLISSLKHQGHTVAKISYQRLPGIDPRPTQQGTCVGSNGHGIASTAGILTSFW